MQLRCVLVSCSCAAFLGTAGMISAASLSHADKQFIVMTASRDMSEAHEGQMAESQATRADVKNFAKTLVRDHTKSYEQLTELAAKKGVSIPRGIDTARNRAIVQLVHSNGRRFDSRFVKDEITSQRRAIAVFRREVKHGRDAEVRNYAAKMLPVLESDLHQAEKCANPSARS
jgi:putative membrane protein